MTEQFQQRGDIVARQREFGNVVAPAVGTLKQRVVLAELEQRLEAVGQLHVRKHGGPSV
jgi:hypothetical protein